MACVVFLSKKKRAQRAIMHMHYVTGGCALYQLIAASTLGALILKIGCVKPTADRQWIGANGVSSGGLGGSAMETARPERQ